MFYCGQLKPLTLISHEWKKEGQAGKHNTFAWKCGKPKDEGENWPEKKYCWVTTATTTGAKNSSQFLSILWKLNFPFFQRDINCRHVGGSWGEKKCITKSGGENGGGGVMEWHFRSLLFLREKKGRGIKMFFVRPSNFWKGYMITFKDLGWCWIGLLIALLLLLWPEKSKEKKWHFSYFCLDFFLFQMYSVFTQKGLEGRKGNATTAIISIDMQPFPTPQKKVRSRSFEYPKIPPHPTQAEAC